MEVLSVGLARGISAASITLMSKEVALGWVGLHDLGLATVNSAFLGVVVDTHLALVGGTLEALSSIWVS
jgi:hypothetical protein